MHQHVKAVAHKNGEEHNSEDYTYACYGFFKDEVFVLESMVHDCHPDIDLESGTHHIDPLFGMRVPHQTKLRDPAAEQERHPSDHNALRRQGEHDNRS